MFKLQKTRFTLNQCNMTSVIYFKLSPFKQPTVTWF